MGFIEEFRKFALRGNMVDMAVGIIIGAAFGKVVSSLVNDLLMPPLGVLIGNVDFSGLALTLRGASADHEAVMLRYGLFINQIVDFAIVALAVFLLIKAMNRLQRPQEAPAPAAPPADVRLLTEIRDLLKARG